MCGLVGARSQDAQFTPAEVRAGFSSLAIPAPSNVPQTLQKLKAKSFVVSHGGGRWQLTPVGLEEVDSVIGKIDASQLAVSAAGLPGAEFAHVEHTVIPHWAAPPRWQVGISRLLEDYPFETNLFCMTRFPSEGPLADPVKTAIALLRDIAAEHGLHLHLASDRLIDDDILGNVGAYMWACQYGVGIVEDRVGRGLNYNAVIELGGMIVTGRRCALLKDSGTPSLPTDLSGQVYKSVDLDDLGSVESAMRTFLGTDLGLRE